MSYGEATLSNNSVIRAMETFIVESILGIEINERDEVNLNCAEATGGICVYSFETMQEDGYSATYVIEKIFDPIKSVCSGLSFSSLSELANPDPNTNPRLAACRNPSYNNEPGLRRDTVHNIGDGELSLILRGGVITHFDSGKIAATQTAIAGIRIFADLIKVSVFFRYFLAKIVKSLTSD